MPDSTETIATCHSCVSPMNVSAVPPFSNVDCPSCGTQSRVKLEFGPYTLVRRHAQGGMSMVFVARDHTLDREVALKILSEDFSADERRIAAFEEEARITASFSHPNVVRVLTTGKAFGRLYIAMEFVPGGHFEHHINERGKIPQMEMLPLAIEVAEGLKAAHAAGLIHRDVKPGNILLDAEGHAKIVDFGLALVTKGGKARASEIWATPYYVPPETIEGEPEDFRSDIYAFGATLYHALAGKPPCGEETMSTKLLREAKKNVVPLGIAEPSLCDDLCQIVDQAMAHQPAGRFSSYEELIRRLEGVLKKLKSGAPGTRESSGHAARRRALKKRREMFALTAAGTAVLMATAGGIWWVTRHDAPLPEPAKPALAASAPTVPESTGSPAGEVARDYREARAALEARDFAKAAEQLVRLRENPAVQEPTRSWAGIEAVAAAFLDGNSSLAAHIARDTAAHAQAAEDESPGVGSELIRILGKLPQLEPISADEAAGDAATRIMGMMIAGLKNWEQGLTAQAVGNFTAANSIKTGANDQWLEIYQNLAGDYLTDARTLAAPVFAELPPTPAACEAAIAQLDSLHSTLKTHGRARFNVRAWQLDLKRHAKILATQQAASADEPPAAPTAWDADAVMVKLAEFADDCEFTAAAAYLHELSAEPGAAAAAQSSLVAVSEAAAVFLSHLEQDLARETVTGEFPLKSGELFRKAMLDPAGKILVSDGSGPPRPAKWADFSPDALIAIHRIFVKNPATEVERLRRHECAISYDWLTGNRARALSAAAQLSQSSFTFKQRWDTIASGLPE